MSEVPHFDVIVCGSLHLDIVVTAPALPRIDETLVGKTWSKVCGGKGGNQAVQAAQAGARTAMLGQVGNDDFGEALRVHLTASSVDHRGVSTDPVNGSGMSVAILQDDGEYGAVIVSGANLSIDSPSLEKQFWMLGGARVLVLQNEIPETVNFAAAQAAKAAGATVVFNAAPARVLTSELLSYVDVLIVNRIEAEAMFGMPVADRTSAKQALAKKSQNSSSIIITLGGKGVVVRDDSGRIVEIEPQKVNVISTHGAGDCFVGVLAAKLAQGMPIVEACRFANSQAAAFVAQVKSGEAHVAPH